MDLPVCISRSQELRTNANSDNGTPYQNVSNHSMYGKMPNDTTTAVQHSPKPISGYQPQLGSGRVALINIAVRTLSNGQVQHIPVSFPTT